MFDVRRWSAGAALLFGALVLLPGGASAADPPVPPPTTGYCLDPHQYPAPGDWPAWRTWVARCVPAANGGWNSGNGGNGADGGFTTGNGRPGFPGWDVFTDPLPRRHHS